MVSKSRNKIHIGKTLATKKLDLGMWSFEMVSKNLALVREIHGTVKRLMFTQSFAMRIHSAKDQVSKQHVCCFDK